MRKYICTKCGNRVQKPKVHSSKRPDGRGNVIGDKFEDGLGHWQCSCGNDKVRVA